MDVFQKCTTEEISQFVGIARRIWLRRNDGAHEGGFWHPTILVQRAKKAWEEFLAVTSENIVQQGRLQPTEFLRWQAPAPGWVKVNWDASIEQSKGWMGYGAVVQDEHGLVIAAQCITVVGCLDPTLAEAGAALKAIQFCRTLGLQRIHYEGDTKIVIDGVNSNEGDWSRTGLMVDDIKLELQHVCQWWMTFVRRNGNQAAHIICRRWPRQIL